MTEKTIFELSSEGRIGFNFPASDVPEYSLPEAFIRAELPMPELSEADVIRHFTRLSHLNYSIDGGFYPLGSCTMKFNPRINEEMARLAGLTSTHPLQPEETTQGNLYLMYTLGEWLKEISGFDAITLQPAAGAHGEFVGALIIAKYHQENNQKQRKIILIPDSAHGTNPATSVMSGFDVITIPSDANGNVDLEVLKTHCNEQLAGLMLTNPNTLGLFDQHVVHVIDLVHQAGGLVYGDGANLNALLGIVKPAELGFDVMHFNLHKTFSTPHGGGGPGAGPVAVTQKLAAFLPDAVVAMIDPGDDENPPLFSLITPEKTIGRMKAFHGHFGVLIRAYTYLAMQGAQGMRNIAEMAVLNANYLMSLVKDHYHIPYMRTCMHEYVAEGCWQDAPAVHALDVAKRLMDYGYHPPTNYFPLIVHEALMIEPTETESKQELDQFAAVLNKIADEAHTDPNLLQTAPHNTPVKRCDEVKAAKDLVFCCRY